MRRLMVFLFVLVLLGCAGSYPKTREEFVAGFKEGGSSAMVDTYIANGQFDAVVSTLKIKAKECFTFNSDFRRSEGGVTTTKIRDGYWVTINVVSQRRAEWTSRHNSSAYIQSTIPEGGLILKAIDIERTGTGKAKLTYYGSNSDASKRAWATIKMWSDGKSAACPGDH